MTSTRHAGPRATGPRRQPVRDVTEYLAHLRRATAAAETQSWFRGIDDARYDLLPGFYWRGLTHEYSLVSSWMSEAPQYLEQDRIPAHRELQSLWEWYFMMQHYGLPTRLLDWTENPLVALFFAASSPSSQVRGGRPCVWVLDPGKLNQKSDGESDIIVPGRAYSEHWLFEEAPGDKDRCAPGKPVTFELEGREYGNQRPIAIFPVRRNRRILAQQGVFTVHGAEPIPLQRMLGKDALGRIDVLEAACPDILVELDALGISRLSLFPELPFLAGKLRDLHASPASAEAPGRAPASRALASGSPRRRSGKGAPARR